MVVFFVPPFLYSSTHDTSDISTAEAIGLAMGIVSGILLLLVIGLFLYTIPRQLRASREWIRARNRNHSLPRSAVMPTTGAAGPISSQPVKSISPIEMKVYEPTTEQRAPTTPIMPIPIHTHLTTTSLIANDTTSPATKQSDISAPPPAYHPTGNTQEPLISASEYVSHSLEIA